MDLQRRATSALPPAFCLRGVAREVYTGDGPVSYWNAYVAITQMHGHGRFVDERIGAYVARTATKLYRTTPLRGLWNPPLLTGPHFHDGSAANGTVTVLETRASPGVPTVFRRLAIAAVLVRKNCCPMAHPDARATARGGEILVDTDGIRALTIRQCFSDRSWSSKWAIDAR